MEIFEFYKTLLSNFVILKFKEIKILFNSLKFRSNYDLQNHFSYRIVFEYKLLKY